MNVPHEHARLHETEEETVTVVTGQGADGRAMSQPKGQLHVSQRVSPRSISLRWMEVLPELVRGVRNLYSPGRLDVEGVRAVTAR